MSQSSTPIIINTPASKEGESKVVVSTGGITITAPPDEPDNELADLDLDVDDTDAMPPPSITTKGRVEFAPRAREKVPLQPGFGLYDWMKIVGTGKNLSGEAGTGTRKISMAEVRKHCTEDDAWMVLRGVVYNVTAYVRFHPGGVEQLLRGVGRDCTDLFDEVHSWVNVEGFLRTCKVGVLDKPMGMPPVGSGWTTPVKPRKATLKSVAVMSSDTKLMRFEVDTDGAAVQLSEGQHLSVRANIRGKLHNRPYTPISAPSALSSSRPYFELIVKVYQDGAVSQYLNGLKTGSVIQFTIPSASFTLPPPNKLTYLGLISGGTGIAALLPILRRLVHDKAYAHVQCDVVTSNFTYQDILCREMIETLVAASGQTPEGTVRVKVFHTVTRSTSQEADKHGCRQGRIDKEWLASVLPPAAPSRAVAVCGPVVMTNAVNAMLGELGYPEENVCLFI